MSEFRVWAPSAKDVDVQFGEGLHSMQSREGGWWYADLKQARPGDDYRFVLDHGVPLPDPRSPWQPDGVHGPSRLIDHRAFPWTDRDWRPPQFCTAIVYELHIGTFTPEGTFESAIGRLGHLAGLGITHVSLMPVQEFSGDWGWGYDGVDLFAPHHAYGGPFGLKRFVDACHARGLAVLLDVVYNHLGPSGNYLSRFGPYFTDRYSTPWGQAVNLDGPGSLQTRRFFCDNALMWLRDYHFDGLRLDAVHAFYDHSAIHFLEQLSLEITRLQSHLGRQLVVIAESDLNDPRLVRSREVSGYGLDAQWSDDFHHALHSFLTGERDGYYSDFGKLSDLAKALKKAYVFDGIYSARRRRVHGRPAAGIPGWRFLGYLQNHDQIGNRMKGERTSHLLNAHRVKMSAALVLLSPFVPMLFQGEEFAASTPFQYFTNHQEKGLGEAVSEGRRREFSSFGWNPEQVPDPQDPASFLRSKLVWQEIEREPHSSVLDWHKRLIVLRRGLPSLSDGCLESVHVEFDEREEWLVLRRGPVAVVCNFASAERAIPLGFDDTVILLSSQEANWPNPLPPESVVILADRNDLEIRDYLCGKQAR